MLKIKLSDIILIALLIILAVGLFILNIQWKTNTGDYAEISFDGKVIKVMPLSKNDIWRFQYDDDFNTIVVKDGKVYVESANCRDKLCTNAKPINMSGETIICLPHKLSIRVYGQESDIDAFVE